MLVNLLWWKEQGLTDIMPPLRADLVSGLDAVRKYNEDDELGMRLNLLIDKYQSFHEMKQLKELEGILKSS